MIMHLIADIPQKVVISRDGKILLLEDHKGNFELPGGRLDEGEDISQSIKRELEEELGVGVEINSVFDTFYFTSKSGAHHYVVLFLGKLASFDIKISSEHKSYKWVGKEDLEKLPMKEGYKQSLEKYFSTRS